MLNTLENLIKLARERKTNPVEGSYTNKLLTDKSLSKAKVLEEIDELIEAIEEAKQRQSGVAYARASDVDEKQGPQLKITVKLSDALKAKLEQGEDKVVFIYAIPADSSKGRMPVAALKMNISDLPTTVVLNNARAMTPQTKLSDVEYVHVYAIVSANGGAGIKPGDYKAELLGIDVNTREPLSLLINDVVE